MRHQAPNLKVRSIPAVALLLMALLTVPGGVLGEGNHVRIVLDTSLSMKGYTNNPALDPGRHAVLATMLLYDLLELNPEHPEHPDSFEVIPFDQNYGQWSNNVRSTAGPIRARGAGISRRPNFVQAMAESSLPYNGQQTYFSPGVKRATRSLANIEGGSEVTRTIVLLTDGVPDAPQRDKAALIALLPTMAAKDIVLNIIGFGPNVLINKNFFDDIMTADQQNVQRRVYNLPVIHKLYTISDGNALPSTMVDLFTVNFGYTAEPISLPPNGRFADIDLNKDIDPDATAVVSLTPGIQLQPQRAPPGLNGTAPAGKNLNSPRGPQDMQAPGAAYTLEWIKKPYKGIYRYETEPGSQAIALRPTRLGIELRAEPPAPPRPVTKIMAETPIPVNYLMTSPAGTAGLPLQLDVSYSIYGPRESDNRYRWADLVDAGVDDQLAFDDPAGTGRLYPVNLTYSRNPKDRNEKYDGHLEVRVKRHRKTVGERVGRQAPYGAFEIEVYPKLEIKPEPDTDNLGSAAIERGDPKQCVRFALEETYGSLDSAGSEPYPVSAYLTLPAAQQGAIQREFNGAEFWLDGESIGWQGTQQQNNTPWALGRQLVKEELVPGLVDITLTGKAPQKAHELCILLGRQTFGDPQKILQLTVNFVLGVSPYDSFNVVSPFVAKTKVAAPPDFELTKLLPFLLLLISFLTSMILLRARLSIPPDLVYGIAPATNPDAFELIHPAPPAPLKMLLSRNAERRLTDSSGNLIGWVRPEAEDLYRLRPEKPVEVRDADDTEPNKDKHGGLLLEAQEIYQVRIGEKALLLRMQYE